MAMAPDTVRAHRGSVPHTLPALFAERAARGPSRPAVRYDGIEWTYATLASRVNRLTRFLQGRGVSRGALVPLVCRPRAEALEAMLAVMQAGAAYVALDPSYPAARLRTVLDEIQAPLLLATRESSGAWRSRATGAVVDLDALDLNGLSSDPVDTALESGDLAYVMYTSGTTGRPNGVQVEHGALTNYLAWCAEYYPLNDRPGGSLVHTSIGFDLTVTSLFVPLCVGQPVTFVTGASNDLQALAGALRGIGEGLSFLKLTPSHLRGLQALLGPSELAKACGTLILGGEPLYGEDLVWLESVLGRSIRAFNEYGPTETVVGSTCYEVQPPPPLGALPIGTPIANTTVDVCDDELRPVAPGGIGELCIGGMGVARGYYRQDALTARKFVSLAWRPGQRVYRTGDLVRQRDDGVLEFVGRRDNQVKVRGHRVELEDIEAALKEHPAVHDVVVVSDANAEATRLVAFVVPNVSRREEQSAAGRVVRVFVGAAELHAHAQTRLPAPMVPAAFVVVEALPMTAHGKADREELRRRAAAEPAAGVEYIAPRTELEQILAAVLANVLKVDAIGIDDNYYALGGDSIRSIQVAGEAQRRGLKVSVGDLHRFPTIRTLAEHVGTAREFIQMPRTQPFDLVSPADRERMPADVEDAYPLNLLQEGMIYHRAFAAKSAVYHAMLSLHLRAPFDLAVLRQVVQELTNRHALLRTSFDQRNFGTALQLVHRAFKDPLQFVDLSGLAPEDQRARVVEWMRDEQKRGFDIDEYPLIRFIVHRLSEDTFYLTLSYHHEIIDGWSESTLVSELLTHYLSLMNGEAVEIVRPKATFRDSVLLEQMALKSDEFRRFWETTLEGASFMRLPRLLSGPKADLGQRAIVKLHYPFPKQRAEALQRLALALAVPLKSVLLAAHMKVMGFFGGSRDVVTHTVSNGRPETPDGAGVIGLFVNSFTFRQQLTHSSWRDLILETLRLEQASVPYRRYPMAELKRHQGSDPLSETLFFLIDYHIYHRLERFTNAKLLNYEVYGESTFPFCATFRVNHFTSELDMQMEYDSLQFPRELIDAIADAYARVHDAMIVNPAAKHHLFDVVTPATPRAAERLAPAPAGGIHQEIERRAASTPDAIALICGDEAVSYGALNGQANQLARALRDRGIGNDATVALFLDRSPALVASMLAVLKTGAGYIPLDPEHRSDRTIAILRETQPSLVLTHERLRDALASAGIANVWCPGSSAADVQRRPSHNLDLPVSPEALAYVIFTSGSTGRSKGVMVSHGSLVRSTAARLSEYASQPERFLLLSSPAFDSSVAGLYWTLCTGGTLVLPSAPEALDLNNVMNVAKLTEVTHTLCIPSLYGSMLDAKRADDLQPLRAVIVAGEECRRELWEHHRATLPHVAFANEYGPSEGTVWSTVWHGGSPVLRAGVPIGTSIANVTTFVLDPDLQTTPTGVAGELCLGGSNLARGYLGNPAATAERFVPNPFAATAGERLYRSGDIARMTTSAELDYLGRLDHQVKVRGFRVEPAEIEAVLETHAKVKRAIVVPRDDHAGEKQLVAYVVPAALGELSPAELMAFAKNKLPKFLIPSSIAVLEALPLTPTGKVDRNALPPMISAERAERIPPRTPTEEAIAGIWCRVLGVDRVGVTEDFFTLGGESLRAMRILSQIRRTFDVELPIASLVNTDATVAALAEALDAALWLQSNPPTTAAVGAGFEDASV